MQTKPQNKKCTLSIRQPLLTMLYTWLSSKKFISSKLLSMSENLGLEAGVRAMQRRAMSQTGSGQFDGQISGNLAPTLPSASDSNVANTSASDRSANGRGHCGVNSSQMTTPRAQTSAASVGRSWGWTTFSGAAQRSGSGRRRCTTYSRENTSTHSDELETFTSKL